MKLSIIIPVRNEAAILGALLAQLEGLRQQGHEIIVVDGGSEDGSLSIAAAGSDLQLATDPGRARQMNAGAARATGDWLLFLHADTCLPVPASGWLGQLQRTSRLWGRFNVRLSGAAWPLRVIECAMNLRSRLTGIATGDQALFVRREIFQQLGGFAAISLMEDVELSHRLKRCSRPLCLASPVITSSRRWEQQGIVRTVLLMWALRLAYFLGAAPDKLLRCYQRGGRR